MIEDVHTPPSLSPCGNQHFCSNSIAESRPILPVSLSFLLVPDLPTDVKFGRTGVGNEQTVILGTTGLRGLSKSFLDQRLRTQSQSKLQTHIGPRSQSSRSSSIWHVRGVAQQQKVMASS